MQLVNLTKMQAGYITTTRVDGRELLVVVTKGTYAIPPPGEEPTLTAEQLPLVERDAFTGEPGFSAPHYEIDFAPHKPRCDVLLGGCAYAPDGRPASRVAVALRVGSLIKSFDVVGDRAWKAGVLHPAATRAEPFTRMPISYDNAFGGIDRTAQDPQKWRYYLPNHAGVGYHAESSGIGPVGKPLPNTEQRGTEITSPSGNYMPMAFGPVGRSWEPRVKWAGTYDAKWLDETSPFLPADFDDRYFQSAPADQQTDYLSGGEEIALLNLTPGGVTKFRLPSELGLSILLILKSGDEVDVPAVVDTVMLEPEKNRLTLLWRASFPLRRSIFDVAEGIVARTIQQARQSRGRDERLLGKSRYSSLAALVASENSRR